MRIGRQFALAGALLAVAVGVGSWRLTRPKQTAPSPTQEYIESGQRNARDGHITAAVIDFNRAMALDPKDERSYIGLAILYEELNRPDLAVEALRQLEITNPEAPNLHSRLAEAYLGAEDLKQARAVGAVAVKREPNSARACSVYGIALARFRYWDAAEEALKRARQFAPGDEAIAQVLVDVYLQKGDYPKAAQLTEELLKKAPDSAKLHYKLGWAYSRVPQQGDTAERAIQHLQRAAELDPKWFEPLAELGRTYRTLGKPDLAQVAFEKAWALNPNVAGVAYNLAGLWGQKQDPRAPAMEKRFRQLMADKERFTALRRDYNSESNNTQNILALAETEAKSGLYAAALHRLWKLLRTDPANTEALRLYQRLDTLARQNNPDYLRPGPGVGLPSSG